MQTAIAHSERRNSERNKLHKSDREFHDWYRFVLSFPPHLVRKYLYEFKLKQDDVVLDPFCGTGTTLIEAKLLNISSIGIEANNFAHFASSVKTNWNTDAKSLFALAKQIKNSALAELDGQHICDEPSANEFVSSLRSLTEEQEKLILKNSISPLPLHKALVLLDHIQKLDTGEYYQYLALAFGNSLVQNASNLRFGPEVGVGKIKTDCTVIQPWFNQVAAMCRDLELVGDKDTGNAEAIFSDSRNLRELIDERRISAVITSPPYPNEKDYTRTTRLESVLLGFIKTKEDLRALKKSLLRSNTRGIYKGDDDDKYVKDFPEIQRIADAIENRRIELEKTSGFERLYAKATKLYFGGIAKHLIELQSILRPGAHLAYVVGDQASYLRVMIRTGNLIADIAEKLGYERVRIDLFRTRFSTATKSDLNEEVVVLKWRG